MESMPISDNIIYEYSKTHYGLSPFKYYWNDGRWNLRLGLRYFVDSICKNIYPPIVKKVLRKQ